MGIKVEEVVLDDESPDANEAIGEEVFKWKSKDGSVWCTFGRAHGIVSLRIARILGPAQAGNGVLDLYYKAIAGIRTWCGEPVEEPMTSLQFDKAFDKFGQDEFLVDYINTWQLALYPELAQALKEAGMMGLGPDDVGRIAENAGKQTAKKSPRRGSRTKS